MKHAAVYTALVSLSLASVASVPRATAAPLTKDQQKCVDALSKALAKVTGTQTKEIETCVARAAKGKLVGVGVDACTTGDAKGKVQKAKDKTFKDAGKKCLTPLPPYGTTNAATVNAVGRQAALDMAHDLFGLNLSKAILTEAADKDGAKCQQAVAAAAKKCRDAKLTEFLKCKKAGLKKGTIDSSAGLAICIGADPTGKIAKTCDDPVKGDTIRKALTKKCVGKGVDLAIAVPPCGVGADVTTTHACLEPTIECRVCRALDQADGLARNCDTFDDGLTNDSCAPSGPLANRIFLPMVVVSTPFGGPQQLADSFTTTFRVQNLGQAEATILSVYYNQDGSAAASGIVTLPVGGKDNLFPGFNDNSSLGPGFVAGGAVLSSDQKIVAIGRVEGFFLDFTAFGAGAYDSLDAGGAGTTLFFPNVTCDFFGRTTTFYVQNTSATDAASCTVTYTADAAGQGAMEARTIAPSGVGIFDQGTNLTPGLGCETLAGGDGMFSGNARVSCTGASVVGTAVELNTAAKTLLAWNGVPQGSTSVSLPLILANDSGFFTGVQVQNVGGSSTDVTVTYGPNTVSGGSAASAETATIAAGASAIFTQNGVSGPNDWGAIGKYVGGAMITQTGNSEVVALVNQRLVSGSIGSSYGGFGPAQATDSLTLPLLFANVFGFSAISIQAVQANTNVTIIYSANAGAGPTPTPNQDTLSFSNAGDAKTIVLDGVSGANDWDTFGPYVGSARVTTNDPIKTIVGIVTTKVVPGFGDSGFTYEAFKID